MKDNLINLLYRSFDDELSDKEKLKLKEALKHSPELQEEYNRIAELRQTITQTATFSFSSSFADNVMRQIRLTIAPKSSMDESWLDALISIFRPIALSAALLILVFMFMNMFQEDKVSLKGAFAVSDVTIEEAYEPTLTLTLE